MQFVSQNQLTNTDFYNIIKSQKRTKPDRKEKNYVDGIQRMGKRTLWDRERKTGRTYCKTL